MKTAYNMYELAVRRRSFCYKSVSYTYSTFRGFRIFQVYRRGTFFVKVEYFLFYRLCYNIQWNTSNSSINTIIFVFIKTKDESAIRTKSLAAMTDSVRLF